MGANGGVRTVIIILVNSFIASWETAAYLRSKWQRTPATHALN